VAKQPHLNFEERNRLHNGNHASNNGNVFGPDRVLLGTLSVGLQHVVHEIGEAFPDLTKATLAERIGQWASDVELGESHEAGVR
jgi:hypothetical protein